MTGLFPNRMYKVQIKLNYGDGQKVIFDDGFESQAVDIYVANGYIPSRWQHDNHLQSDWGYLWNQWSWPDNGTWWIVLKSESAIQELNIGVSWQEAPIPPSLDEMTELNDGVAVTGLDSLKNDNNVEDLHYFYVDLKDNLSQLQVKTFGGRGDADLFIEKDHVPSTSQTWITDDGINGVVGQEQGGQSGSAGKNSDQSTSPGPDETVHIFAAEPGMYYIVIQGYGRFHDVSIQADFTYALLSGVRFLIPPRLHGSSFFSGEGARQDEHPGGPSPPLHCAQEENTAVRG